jgi:hypothetical protein
MAASSPKPHLREFLSVRRQANAQRPSDRDNRYIPDKYLLLGHLNLAGVDTLNDVVGVLSINGAADRLGGSEDLLWSFRSGSGGGEGFGGSEMAREREKAGERTMEMS